VRGAVVRLVHLSQAATPTQVGTLATRALEALRQGQIAAAQAAADTARALVAARPPGHRHHDPDGLAELGWAESWLERYPDAEAHLRTGIAAARRAGREDLMPRLLVALAHVACWTGQLPTAVRLARGARRHGDREVRGAAAALEGIATLWIGGRDNPVRSLELARVAVAEAGLDGWSGRVALASLGQARLFSDDAAGCLRLVLEAGRDTELSGLPASLRPMWFSLLCATSLRIGDLDAAGAWAHRAEAMRRHVGLPGQRAFAAMATGQVLLRRGDAAGAAAHLSSAAGGFDQSGMRLLHALALVAGARATSADRDPVSAAAMRERAHRVAVSCGSQRIVAMAARAMAPAAPAVACPAAAAPAVASPPPAAPAAAPAAPVRSSDRDRPGRTESPPDPALPEVPPAIPGDPLSSLTVRERQIAWIAGHGAKTSTVARQLGVSPRTIDVHLSRIYRKLGVPGRAGLVAIVARMEPTAPVSADAPSQLR
jgi:DNA-binding CsgD family transcriptional regulator